MIITLCGHGRYVCTLPKARVSQAADADQHNGPNALEILQKLFISQSCAYRYLAVIQLIPIEKNIK